MILNVYSIYDSAAKAYTQPFFMHNDGLAIRAFQDNVNSKEENNISKHPDQFTLYKIGSYNDETGQITKQDINKSLGNGIEFVNDPVITETDAKIITEKLDQLLKAS